MKNPESLSWHAVADIENPLWHEFSTQEKLTALQLEQFQQYYALLHEWNQRINITRIVTLPDVLAYHFSDSLRFGDCMDATKAGISLIDVGSGGGFPGIPLKIKYPNMRIILLEVTNKRVLFLKEVIVHLGLEDISIDTLDWRTYLHHADGPVEFVCARASLPVEELVRVYEHGSGYASTKVVYWASAQWQADASYAGDIEQDYTYVVGEKTRRLIIIHRPKKKKGIYT